MKIKLYNGLDIIYEAIGPDDQSNYYYMAHGSLQNCKKEYFEIIGDQEQKEILLNEYLKGFKDGVESRPEKNQGPLDSIALLKPKRVVMEF